MLFDLYGDFGIEGGRPGSMRLAAIIHLAETLGSSGVSVRAAAVRMAREGWLSAERTGRESTYHLTQAGWQLVEEGRLRMFGASHEAWDQRWCLIALSVPEARREVRDRLRRQLTWLGFGSPSAGLYVSPHDHHASVERLAGELEAAEFVQIYQAVSLRPADPRDVVARAWTELDRVNARYAEFLERFGAEGARIKQEVRAARFADEDAFRLRFALASQFRHCLYADPELPSELAPVNWCGGTARRLFVELHALVTPGGMRYFEAANRTPG